MNVLDSSSDAMSLVEIQQQIVASILKTVPSMNKTQRRFKKEYEKRVRETTTLKSIEYVLCSYTPVLSINGNSANAVLRQSISKL